MFSHLLLTLGFIFYQLNTFQQSVFLFLEKLQDILEYIEQLNSPQSPWRWRVHFKSHKKLREHSRFDTKPQPFKLQEAHAHFLPSGDTESRNWVKWFSSWLTALQELIMTDCVLFVFQAQNWCFEPVWDPQWIWEETHRWDPVIPRLWHSITSSTWPWLSSGSASEIHQTTTPDISDRYNDTSVLPNSCLAVCCQHIASTFAWNNCV